MIDIRKFAMLLAIGVCFSVPSFAAEQEQTISINQAQPQSLELETADVSVLQLSSVQAEGVQNSNEVHQEATLGRAGLAGACTSHCTSICSPGG